MTGKLEVIGSSVALVPRNALGESYAATNIPAAVARKKAGILDSGLVEMVAGGRFELTTFGL
jgi:hypothetical protein